MSLFEKCLIIASLLVCLFLLSGCSSSNASKDFSLHAYKDGQPVLSEYPQEYRLLASPLGSWGYVISDENEIPAQGIGCFTLSGSIDCEATQDIASVSYSSTQEEVSLYKQNEFLHPSFVLHGSPNIEISVSGSEATNHSFVIWVLIDSFEIDRAEPSVFCKTEEVQPFIINSLQDDFMIIRVEYTDGSVVEKSYSLKLASEIEEETLEYMVLERPL